MYFSGAERRIPVIDEGLDGRIVLHFRKAVRSQFGDPRPRILGSDTRIEPCATWCSKSSFSLGTLTNVRTLASENTGSRPLVFFVLRVPRQRRPLHEAERHPESHRTRANVVRKPLPPCKNQQKIRAFLLPRSGRKMGETYLGECTDDFYLRCLFGPRLVEFCVPLGFGESFPILVMGKQRTTGGAAKEDLCCVRNPPILICIQVLPRTGAIAKPRGALRCHTL